MSEMVEPHPALELGDLIHQRTRLGILTILAESERADFSYLKDALELTDGNLGRHLETLREAGLIDIEKGYAGRRPKTWAMITIAGKHALAEHVATLREIVARVERSTGRP
jgi:DNA-binding transcriptional ArsR family regulator